MFYDLVIVGGGPAGAGAAVYAARKKMKTLIATDSWGGQSLVSADIQNWIGTPHISGLELAKMLEAHVRAYQPDVEILEERIEKIDSKNGGFVLISQSGQTIEAKTVLICTGSRRRRLGVPGEDKLDGKGIAWCGTCDAPLFKDKVVAVIGGGNAGLETVLDLNPYASQIYLFHRRDQLKGDPLTQEKVLSNKKVTVIYNAETQEILGDQFVSGLRYKDSKIGAEKTLGLEGVFVEIGNVPNSDIVKHLVKTDEWGQIVVDHKTQQTLAKGIWAAGDVTDVLNKQNNISVGDAIKAVLNIYSYVWG